MRGIAFYGKGGIGKSTVLSNVTAVLAKRGRRILQIGCDPKHDSTRLILGGFTQATVLEQLSKTGSVSLDSVMLTGCSGIKCIESGGPEPGVGCAGRGIIQMLNLLNGQGLDISQFDYVFFDILGDVVCGGFAVPMRAGYANEIYIVTSGEIAALYAANNIAKGIKRFSEPNGKLGGIIGNGRGTRNEKETIAAFAKSIGTEMVAFIPRSELVVRAEFDSKPIIEYAPNSELTHVFQSIADHIEQQQPPVVPKPLNDKDLDDFLHECCYNPKLNQTPVDPAPAQNAMNQTQPQRSLTGSVPSFSRNPVGPTSYNCPSSINRSINRPALQGCSLAGAYVAIKNIKDGITIMHAPQGCAYVSFSGFLSRAALSSSEPRRVPSLLCTNMQETDVVFGGLENLRETVLQAHKKFPSYSIFVITCCAVGIIGDDIRQIETELKAEGINVYYIPTEGVMNDGDFYTGLLNSYRVVAENMIDRTVSPEPGLVNILEQFHHHYNNQDCKESIDEIFEKLHIKVNCRFIGDTTTAEIRHFKKASVNIPLSRDPLVRELAKFFESRFSIETLKVPPPVGFEQTAEFTRALGRRFNKQTEAEELISKARILYEERLSSLRKYFSGKKALIFSSPHNIDWLISTLIDLEVNIPKICSSSIFAPRDSYSTKYSSTVPIENNLPEDTFEQALREGKPDFVLTTGFVNAFRTLPCDVIPSAVFPARPIYGFNGGLVFADHLYSKLRFPTVEGWRNDKELFKSCA